MITSSNGNQYLRPDYLTPLPTTLDAKKSPLALLAQTCSQIGADTPATKAILSSNDKGSKKESPPAREKSSPASTSSSSASSSCSPPASTAKSSFKPYESSEEACKPIGGGKMKKGAGSNQSSPRSSPSRKTPQHQQQHQQQQQEGNSRPGDVSPGAVNRAASPVKPPPLGSYLYPELMGLRSPYLGYPRLKGDVPCRDPYCTGCHLLGKTCPAGCAQCEKAAAFLPAHQQHAAAAAAYAHAQLAALAAAASAQPYVCSWIAGDAAYCGKRFATSEELLAHLRTHTSDSLLSPPPPPAHPALLHRTYPTPPLSPLATTARYHPYSKPALLPPSLTTPPFALPHHPGLPPYLSPYSLYGPRLGASHP